ncbi:activin receptor type-2B-like [Clytia hemisphaerica]
MKTNLTSSRKFLMAEPPHRFISTKQTPFQRIENGILPNKTGRRVDLSSQNITQIVLPCILIILVFLLFYWIKLGIASWFKQKCRLPDYSNVQDNMVDLNNISCGEVIGHGSFGTVIKGKYDELDVALKITCFEKYKRWLNEKSILMENNDDSNVIKLIDYGVKLMQNGETYLCLVLEYADLDCLRSHLQQNSINLQQCLHLVFTLTSAVRYIHSDRSGMGCKKLPVVHQDIKSANVLLSSVKGCILGDFGLACQLGDFPIYEKCQVGTPRYMSPEKLKGNSLDVELLLKSDIYALALVFYEILSRCYLVDSQGQLYLPGLYKTPFSDWVGSNPTIETMQEIVLVKNVRPKVKQWWRENQILCCILNIVEKCWSTDPDQRLDASSIFRRIRNIYSQLKFENQLC